MSHQDIVIFHDTDLPNMERHCPQADCGYSIYRGVLVQWDQDQDDRVLHFIDSLPDEVRSDLLVIQESRAQLGLLWKHSVPEGYEKGVSFDDSTDVWHVAKSGSPDGV